MSLPFPAPDTAASDPFARLLEQRRVFLRGPLDHAAATHVAAQLMTLDGESDREVKLLISSPGGAVDDVFAVLDVIDAMRAPVRTTALGQAEGTAAAVLACGTGGRVVAPHARVSLRVDVPLSIESGRAEDLERVVDGVVVRRRQLAARLARATGRRADDIEHDLDHGPLLSAADACGGGLADEIL